MQDDNLTTEQARDAVPAEAEPSEVGGEEQSTQTTETGTEGETDANSEGDEGKEKAEPAEEEATDEDDDEPKRRRRSGTERLKRRIETLEAELRSARGRQGGDGADLAGAVEREIGPPPKQDDFDDFFAYQTALQAYETEKRIATREIRKAAEAREANDRAHYEDLVTEHRERAQAAAKSIADFEEVVTQAARTGTLKVTPAIEREILESDKSALIAYHLAKHPEKVAELNAMTPTRAAREIGRLEARLSLPNPNRTTKAPAPVAPVKGGAAPSSPERDLDAWLAKTYPKRR